MVPIPTSRWRSVIMVTLLLLTEPVINFAVPDACFEAEEVQICCHPEQDTVVRKTLLQNQPGTDPPVPCELTQAQKEAADDSIDNGPLTSGKCQRLGNLLATNKCVCHGYAFEGGAKHISSPANYLGPYFPCYEVVTTGATHARWGDTHSAFMGAQGNWLYTGKLGFGPPVYHSNGIYGAPQEYWKQRAYTGLP
jgi:hypothetical protein